MTPNSDRSAQVLYIDTERKFSAGRLVEIAAARAGDPTPALGDGAPHPGDPAALAVRVLVASPASARELLSMLQVRRHTRAGAAAAEISAGLPQQRNTSDCILWQCVPNSSLKLQTEVLVSGRPFSDAAS